MLHKERVCSMFKQLEPHKRIDFMCGMLNLCHPFELRFFGSYVEDLAKKDFNSLREAEGKANNRNELTKCIEADDKSFRSKVAVYLALLKSSSRTCANFIYDMLENHIQKSLSVISDMDEPTVLNILIVLAMAMNHPAFQYSQKMRMYDWYENAKKAAEQILKVILQEI